MESAPTGVERLDFPVAQPSQISNDLGQNTAWKAGESGHSREKRGALRREKESEDEPAIELRHDRSIEREHGAAYISQPGFLGWNGFKKPLSLGTAGITNNLADNWLHKHIHQKVWQQTPIPRNGFRILKLWGGSGPLEGDLICCSENAPEYEALSYTWGANKTDAIRIFSGGGVYEVPVTSNLSFALQCLRFRQEARYLWVDALCINQDDAIEKSQQIRKMASIYNNAQRVLVWLGQGDDDSERALGFVHRINNLGEFERLIEDEKSVKDWNALLEVMTRKWFSRRWVIQEIALARQAIVHCGLTSVLWRDLASAINLFASHLEQISRLFQSPPAYEYPPNLLGDIKASTAYELVRQSTSFIRKSEDGSILECLVPLEHLVSILAPYEVSVPHDSIYALLSLAEDVGPAFSARPSVAPAPKPDREGDDQSLMAEQPEPLSAVGLERAKLAVLALQKKHEEALHVDYTKSFLEVSKDFLNFVIRRSHSLDIICRPWAPVTPGTSLPSWIPVRAKTKFNSGRNLMHSRVRGETLVGIPTGGRRTYNAARKFALGFTYHFRIDPVAESHSLFVDGFVLDSIQRKSLPAIQGNIPFEWIGFVEWEDVNLGPPDAFWRTLVANRTSDGNPPPHYYEHACHQAFLYSDGDDLNTDRVLSAHRNVRLVTAKIITEFLQRVQAVVWRRRMALTGELSALGLVPENTKKRDLVCILAGCSVPVILREKIDNDNGKTFHVIIGESYIHGMMDGEAYRVKQTKNIPIRTFELR